MGRRVAEHDLLTSPVCNSEDGCSAPGHPRPHGPGVCLLQCGDVSSQKITRCLVSGRGKRGTHPSSEWLLWKSHLQTLRIRLMGLWLPGIHVPCPGDVWTWRIPLLRISWIDISSSKVPFLLCIYA